MLACALASSCGGGAFDAGGVRVVADRAYVSDDGDRVFVSAYVRAYADDAPHAFAWDVKVAWERREPRSWGCSLFDGFTTDASTTTPPITLARGEASDLRIGAMADPYLACERDERTVVCGEPVVVVLVPRGEGPVVTVPTTADCFLRVP